MSITTKQRAFTLAEVLITLTIIGVIAGMTIPSISLSTNQVENVYRWRKAFSNLSNIYTRIKGENGGSYAGLCGGSDDHYCHRDHFLKYINYTKKTDWQQSAAEGCWAASGFNLDGSVTGWPNNDSCFIDNLGVSYYVYRFESTCNTSTTPCGYIIVDVNGTKEPNTYGLDIFRMTMYSDRIVPRSDGGPGGVCDPAIESSGKGCSMYYLLNDPQ